MLARCLTEQPQKTVALCVNRRAHAETVIYHLKRWEDLGCVLRVDNRNWSLAPGNSATTIAGAVRERDDVERRAAVRAQRYERDRLAMAQWLGRTDVGKEAGT